MGAEQSLVKSKNSDNVDGKIVSNLDLATQSSISEQNFDLYSPVSQFNHDESCDRKITDNNGNKSGLPGEDADVMNRSTLVVVNTVENEESKIESDPLFIRINQIPMFVPILDNQSRKFPWSKPNPDQPSSKLHRSAGTRIGQLYNGYLKKHTQIIANDQNHLSKRIKVANAEVNMMLKMFTSRQRQHANHAHKFGQITEISRTLLKCQNTLQDALKTAEMLNDMLPEDDKLEPFVWCADTDVESSCYLNVNVKEERPISVSHFPS